MQFHSGQGSKHVFSALNSDALIDDRRERLYCPANHFNNVIALTFVPCVYV